MGKKLFISNRSNETVELCREWIGNFLQGMLDAGFVQASDSGQVDPSTLALGSATGSYGYAVFRFDDALQATHPVFFRVDFNTSTSTSSVTSPSAGAATMRLTVGRGTDGAGTITGVLYSRENFGSASPAGTSGATQTPYTHAAFAGDGYAGLIGFVDDTRGGAIPATPYLGLGFLIERSRNAAGEATGEGVLVLVSPYLYNNGMALRSTNSIVPSAPESELRVKAVNYETGQWMGGMAPVATFGYINGMTLGPTVSMASGSIGPVFPWDVVAPGLAPWRSCVVVSIPAGDMPGGVFETKLCGSTGKFYPINASQSNARWGIAFGVEATRYFGVGVRWED